jgi:hypothetical protein
MALLGTYITIRKPQFVAVVFLLAFGLGGKVCWGGEEFIVNQKLKGYHYSTLESPTFTAPSAITIYKDELCLYNANPSITGKPTNIIIDPACEPSTESYSDTELTGLCEGEIIIERTWKVADNCDNFTEKTQIITVKDETVPIISGTIPSGQTNMNLCFADIPTGPSIEEIAALFSDNCSPVTVTKSGTSTGDNCNWNVTYSYVVKDDCGNIVSPSPTVTYSGGDKSAPSLTGTIPSGQTNMNLCFADIPTGPSIEEIAALFSDNCSPVTVTKSGTSTGDNCNWNVTYSYVVKDDCGNIVSPAPFVTYSGKDNSAPSLNGTIPSGQTNMNLCFADIPTGPPIEEIAALFSDNCNPVTVTKSGTPTGDNCNWSVTYSYEVKDDCGNIVSPVPSVTYSGKDNSAPSMNGTIPSGQTNMNLCLADIPAGPTSDEIAAQYSDNCNSVIVNKSGTPSGDNCAWTVTYTYEVKDACGNILSPSPTVTYSGGDKSAPSLSGSIPTGQSNMNLCLADIPAGPTSDEIAAQYSDNCNSVIVNKSGTPSGDNCAWTVTYTYEVKDACGNILSPSPTVTYSGGDKSAPSLSGSIPTGQSNMNLCFADIPIGPTSDEIAAQYSDNCNSVIVIKSGTPSGDNCAWTVTYTYEVKDACGNILSPSPTVTYSGGDKSAPSLSGSIPTGQTNMNLCFADIPAGPTSDEIAAQYTDNCNSVIVIKSGTPTGDNCTWTVTYTYEVKDACGNILSPSPTVTYSGGDKSAPSLSGSIPTGQTNMNLCFADIPAGPTSDEIAVQYTDNCSTVTVTKSGTPSGDNCAWIVIYTYEVKDDCGNILSPSPTVTYSGREQTPPSLINLAPQGQTGVDACLTNAEQVTKAHFESIDLALFYSDNCGGSVSAAIIGTTPMTGNNNCYWELLYTYEVSDICGNKLTNQTIAYTGGDKTPPVFISCPSNLTVPTPNDIPEPVKVSYLDPCDNVIKEIDPYNPEHSLSYREEAFFSEDGTVVGYCPVRIVRYYTVQDNCLNSITCTQEITIQDISNCSLCQESVHYYRVDITGSTTVVQTELLGRGGLCCTEISPSRCYGFDVILDPDAVGLKIEVAINDNDKWTPQGQAEAGDWSIECGVIDFQKDGVLCLNDQKFFTLLHCKPGGNKLKYRFSNVMGAVVTGPTATRIECDRNLSVTGIINPVWNSVSPGLPGQYNNFLDVSDPFNPVFIPKSPLNLPSQILYEVCGDLVGNDCQAGRDCAIAAVNVYDEINILLSGDLEFCENTIGTPDGTILATVTPNNETFLIELFEGRNATGVLLKTTSGGRTITFQPDKVGTTEYSIRATSLTYQNVECSETIYNFPVTINPLPQFTVSNRAMCFGDTVKVSLPDEYTYIWTPSAGVANGSISGEFILSPSVTTQYTIQATSSAGCVSSRQMTITPQNCLVCPGPVTICPDGDYLITSIAQFEQIGGTANFPCQAVSIERISDIQIQVLTPCGDVRRHTYLIKDACGNESVCDMDVRREDNDAPVITCPQNRNIICIDSYLPDNTGFATAIDNCTTYPAITYTDLPFNFSECGFTITRNWKATDDCGHTATCIQTITVEPAPQAQFDAVTPLTITCDQATTFAATNLAYTNAGLGGCLISGQVLGVISGTYDECGGTLTQTWTFTDDCNRTSTQTQTITVEPAPQAQFDAVTPLTITCDQATTFAATNLAYTNAGLGGCLISGQVLGVISGTYDECGGTLTQTWTFTDDCNRTSTQTQTITVEPAPQAQFDAVTPLTITCDQATTFAATNLAYTNAGLGGCLISGQVLGVISGTYDECGGTLTQTWTFTDDCNRTSTQTQTITVEPAPQAQFDAVTPLTITCDQATTFAATNLAYTNAGLGGCLISGQVLGVISGTYDECGGTLTQTWTFTDDCNRTSTQTQTITVEPAPQAQFDAVTPLTITCDQATTFAATNLAYTNAGLGGCLISGQVLGVISGTYDECGGTLTQTWTFTDDCNRTSTQTQTITVEPAPQAQFDAVTPLTITCDQATTFAATNLAYTNAGLGGCLISGQVLGVISGTYDECGGTLTQTWTFTDDCNRTSTQTQTITVEPAPQAQFDAVTPLTITCDQATTFAATNLAYTNAGLGGCLISGQVLGVISGTYDECGGTLTQTWTFTDDCNRTSTQTQTITVEPAPQAQFDAVTPLTITCDQATTFAATNLAYTNAGLGGCLISGQVLGVISGTYDECGGTLTQTWTFTDDCNRTSTQTQTITVEPAPQAQFDAVTPLTITCDQATTFAATNLAYTNAGLGGCLISGQVLGVISGTYDECGGTLTQTWTFTDDCNRTSTQTQTITVEPAPQAQFDAVTPLTITCDQATTFAATNLAYTNAGLGGCLISGQVLGVISGTYDECGGTLTQTWTFTDDCNRTSTQTQTITVEPAPQAQFDAVTPLTITCDQATTFAATNLAYTNAGLGGCLISGQVLGVISGTYDECGGTLTQTWTFTDDCNRTSTQTQTITVEPAPQAQFDAVTPLTITCDQATTFAATNLAYTNAGLGGCLISGQVLGVISGTYDECGGTLTQTWTFTDDCNRTSTQTQTITVEPAPQAQFDAVTPLTITCDQATTFAATNLAYTNAGLGGCLISGQVLGCDLRYL